MMPLKIYRTALFFGVNFFFLFAGIAANLLAVGSRQKRAKVQALLTMTWSRAMCKVLGIHVNKSGERQKTGGFTVCNHISYVDVFVMGSIRPTAFLSKSEVKGWPLVGWLASLGGTVFVDRGSKRAALDAMREIEQKIGCGVTVVIFPEGTTSSGKTVRAFKSTFFNVPAGMKIPVTPASIGYAPDILDAVAWYGGKEIVPHFVNLAGFRKVEADVHFSPPVSRPSEDVTVVEARKLICSRAHESVIAGLCAAKRK